MSLIRKLLNIIKSIGVLNMLEEDLLNLLRRQVYVRNPRGIIALLRNINDEVFKLPNLREVVFIFHGYIVTATRIEDTYSFLITPGIFEEYELIKEIFLEDCDFHFFYVGEMDKLAIACYTENLNSLINAFNFLFSLVNL